MEATVRQVAPFPFDHARRGDHRCPSTVGPAGRAITGRRTAPMPGGSIVALALAACGHSNAQTPDAGAPA
jgi:hypothetical protein